MDAVPVTVTPLPEDSRDTEAAPSWRFQLGGLVLVGLVVVGYVAGVLVPYVVNDLHLVPLAEVAGGAHDPRDLWPGSSTVAGGLVQVGGLLAVTAGMLVALGVVVAVPWTLWEWRGRTTRGARLLARCAVGLSVSYLAWLWSPWGQALSAWRLD